MRSLLVTLESCAQVLFRSSQPVLWLFGWPRGRLSDGRSHDRRGRCGKLGLFGPQSWRGNKGSPLEKHLRPTQGIQSKVSSKLIPSQQTARFYLTFYQKRGDAWRRKNSISITFSIVLFSSTIEFPRRLGFPPDTFMMRCTVWPLIRLAITTWWAGLEMKVTAIATETQLRQFQAATFGSHTLSYWINR